MSRRFEHTEHHSRPPLSGGVVFGLILIALGVVFLLENLGGGVCAENVLNLWPCALVALGLLKLWNRGFFSVWGQLLVAGGVLLQLDIWWPKLAVAEVWWPILVVWAGLCVVAKAFSPKGRTPAARGIMRGPCGRRRYGDAEDVDAGSVTITRDEGEEAAQ